MVDPSVYRRRRNEYMERIGPDAVALVHSPPEARRNGDVYHPFRQSSDLYYLTGFAEPEATLILRPGADKERVTLFVRPRDPAREVWDGRRAGVEGAVEKYGADVAYPSEELDRRLPELLANADDLYYSLGIDHELDREVTSVLAALRMRERKGRRPPQRVVDPRVVLHEMRLRKGAEEIDLLRRAADITAEAHREAMRAAAPGVFEYELEAAINHTFRRRGGAGPGYPSIVGSGENATILHHIENDRALQEGDLVLVDAGCEYGLYTADVTRTFPVSGRFSEVQRRVYELVLAVQEEAISIAGPGSTLDAIHDRCVERLTEGMIELGLLEGTANERIEDGSYKRFYMHRTSHWLGLDVHDVGTYNEAGKARPLEPGMVITIEPGLYVAPDAEGAPEELRGIGVRIEDDVLITKEGREVLSAATPKKLADVEAACQS